MQMNSNHIVELGLIRVIKSITAKTFTINSLKICGIDIWNQEVLSSLIRLNEEGFIERVDGKAGIGIKRTHQGDLTPNVVSLKKSANFSFEKFQQWRGNMENKVFIVHGSNLRVRNDIDLYLTKELGLKTHVMVMRMQEELCQKSLKILLMNVFLRFL